LAHYLTTIGIFWLIAVFWINASLPEAALWAGLLPGVMAGFVLSVQELRCEAPPPCHWKMATAPLYAGCGRPVQHHGPAANRPPSGD
jgi:hypothetical protein